MPKQSQVTGDQASAEALKNLRVHLLQREAVMLAEPKPAVVAGCAEARRLIALANQRLRKLECDAASDLLQAAINALPRRSGKKRSR